MCDHLIGNSGPLRCVRTDEHTTHVYAASNVPDKHDDSEQEAEVRHG